MHLTPSTLPIGRLADRRVPVSVAFSRQAAAGREFQVSSDPSLKSGGLVAGDISQAYGKNTAVTVREPRAPVLGFSGCLQLLLDSLTRKCYHLCCGQIIVPIITKAGRAT